MIKCSIEYNQHYPILTVTADGVHDVGRMLATLARGNVEHADAARKAATAMRETGGLGVATLAYLESHGGPRLGNDPNTVCGDCGAQRYIDEGLVPLPINCPECLYGRLAPRNEDCAKRQEQGK